MSDERPWLELDPGPEAGAVVQITREFPVPREEVFRAWTDADLFRQWFTPPQGSSPEAELDVRPGGAYRVAMKPPGGAGPTTYAVGTYLEVEPPERLVYTFGWEALPERDTLAEFDLEALEDLDSRVTVRFRDLGSSTEVSLTHERLDTPDLRAFHRWGWQSSLDKLGRVL